MQNDDATSKPTTQQFLELLFPDLNGDYLELRLIEAAESPRIQSSFYQTIPQFVQTAPTTLEQQQGYHVYFGVCPRHQRNGSKASVATVACLWADLDAKMFAGGKPDALKRLREFPVHPTVTIDSGHGFHGYWRLKEPESIADPPDAVRVEAYLKALAKALGGDPQVTELARVMRLPGTVNVKNPAQPLPAQIVTWQPERQCNLEDFDRFLVLPAPDQKKNPPGWIAEALEGLQEGNRNGTFAKIAGKLHRDGWSAEDMLVLLTPQADRVDFSRAELEGVVASITRYPQEARGARESTAGHGEEKSPADRLTELEHRAALVHEEQPLPEHLTTPAGRRGYFQDQVEMFASLTLTATQQERLCQLGQAFGVTKANGRALLKAGRANVAAQAATVPSEFHGLHIHPAVHFESAWAAVGVARKIGSKPQVDIVTSTRQAYTCQDVAGALMFTPKVYDDFIGRWPDEPLAAFLAGEDTGSLAEMAALLIKHTRRLIEFKHTQERVVVVCWIIGTYFAQLFTTFPRLNFLGEKGSGKSKVQELIAAVAFNGLLRVDPTAAVLFRLAAAHRPTFCLDEMEGVSSEECRELLAIINSGYKRGAKVDRCEGDGHEVKSYAVYTPMSLSGIKGLNVVTEDRAIVVVMQKSQERKKANAMVDMEAAVWGEIRARGYEVLLTRFQQVAQAYQQLEAPDWMVGREWELWQPLLAVAQLVDEGSQLGLYDDLVALAKAQTEERADCSLESEALIEALEQQLVDAVVDEEGKTHTVRLDEARFRPGDLCGAMEATLKERVTPHQVGVVLRRLGFQRAKRGRSGTRTGSLYEVTRGQLEQVKARYTPKLLQHCNNGALQQ